LDVARDLGRGWSLDIALQKELCLRARISCDNHGRRMEGSQMLKTNSCRTCTAIPTVDIPQPERWSMIVLLNLT
jgi:hypothetical protein